MKVERSVLIERRVDEVFAFVSDPRNDSQWCSKVVAVEQMVGEGPGLGAGYAVVHKPVPGRPERRMEYECLGWEPPRRIDWREDDGTDVIRVTYELEDIGGQTRMTQRDDAELGAPRFLRPVFKAGIARDVARPLNALKKVLEGR
jgi:Polyketide cyclase / dehydrase and lipid transport